MMKKTKINLISIAALLLVMSFLVFNYVVNKEAAVPVATDVIVEIEQDVVVPVDTDDIVHVKFVTTAGEFVVELYPDKAPQTVENFLTYVDDGYYDGTIYHRVIKNFMIQGGGFTPDFVKKTTAAPIKNESDNGLKNVIGSIAMARTNDIDSATSQFFINTKDNAFLDYSGGRYGYAVFGKVIEGYEIITIIDNIVTGDRGQYSDVPVDDVLMETVSRL